MLDGHQLVDNLRAVLVGHELRVLDCRQSMHAVTIAGPTLNVDISLVVGQAGLSGAVHKMPRVRFAVVLWCPARHAADSPGMVSIPLADIG